MTRDLLIHDKNDVEQYSAPFRYECNGDQPIVSFKVFASAGASGTISGLQAILKNGEKGPVIGKESYEDVHTKKFSFSLVVKGLKKIRIRVNNFCIQQIQFRTATTVQETQISSAGVWSEILLE